MSAQSTKSSDAVRARIAAATEIIPAFSARLHADLGRVASSWKADGTRVTETDQALSDGILSALAAQFPADQGLSEELVVDQPIEVTSQFAWVLDPIDGTNNFAAGLAQCAISLALLADGLPIYGFVYDASRRKLIHGGPGHGLWDGEEAASMCPGRLHSASPIGFHSPHDKTLYRGHGEAMVSACKVRALGSSALHLAYVAIGLLEGTVDHNVKLWDIAAGIALLEATGGEIRFLAHGPLPLRRFDLDMPRILYVGGNSGMCDDLEAVIRSASRADAEAVT